MNWTEQERFPMTWYNAKSLESALKGKLPSLKQLQEAFNNNEEGFDKLTYWTGESKEGDKYNAWMFDFETGKIYYLVKTYACYVRLINE